MPLASNRQTVRGCRHRGVTGGLVECEPNSKPLSSHSRCINQRCNVAEQHRFTICVVTKRTVDLAIVGIAVGAVQRRSGEHEEIPVADSHVPKSSIASRFPKQPPRRWPQAKCLVTGYLSGLSPNLLGQLRLTRT